MKITIPHIGKTVDIDMDIDVLQIIGTNGSGKTLLLKEIQRILTDQGHTTIFNTSMEFPILTDDFLDFYEKYIPISVEQFKSLSVGFKESFDLWQENSNKSPKEIIMMEGNGTQQIFKVLCKLNSMPMVEYCLLDLPETSVHIQMLRALLDAYLVWFPNTSFFITTHNPSLLDRKFEILSLDQGEF